MMEISIKQENLQQAINNVGRVANSKSQLPILSNILLKTEKNRLLVAATNLEIATTQLIGAKVLTAGSVTVPARLLTEFIANLPNGVIDMKVVANNLKIQSGKYTATINGIIADDFPELPTINEDSSIKFEMDLDYFKRSVTQVLFSVSADMTRPVLTGVNWQTFDNKLVWASTDGFRLSEKITIETKTEVSCIIPASTLQEVSKIVVDECEVLDILIDETQVRFRLNEVEIISRLIDGKFPLYRQLIPKKNSTIIKINKQELSRIAKIAGLFSRDTNSSITLKASKTSSILTSNSVTSELGENTSQANANISSDGQVTLSSKYLLEGLSAIDEDEVIFSFSGKLSPCILKSAQNNPNYYHVIMPIKS